MSKDFTFYYSASQWNDAEDFEADVDHDSDDDQITVHNFNSGGHFYMAFKPDGARHFVEVLTGALDQIAARREPTDEQLTRVGGAEPDGRDENDPSL